jgi:hypothetical protein
MDNLFEKNGLEKTLARIENLSPTTEAQWGKMKVDQMLAHVNVAYDMFYNKDNYPANGFFKKLLLKTFVKPPVVGLKPYPKNGRTAPVFIIKDRKDFVAEKQRLVDHLNKTAEHGAHYFEGKESHSFGKMSSEEWNVLFAKHIDHHLRQFGV